MATFPAGIDPEQPGSRFTLRPALAIMVGEVDHSHLDDDEFTAKAIEDVVGDWILGEQEVLGAGNAVGGAIGRGADGWAPVVEWLIQPAVAGVVGAISWELTKAAGRKFLEVLREARGDPRHHGVLISRGAAALVAAAVVDESENTDKCVVEAVEEPSSLAHGEFHELNYVGIEPWIVLIADRGTMERHIVVVSPEGDVRGHMRFPMEEWEHLY